MTSKRDVLLCAVEVSDAIPDEAAPSPYEEVERRDMIQFVRETVRRLPLQLQQVLAARFELGGRERCSRVQMSAALKVSLERGCRIESDAILALMKMLVACNADGMNGGRGRRRKARFSYPDMARAGRLFKAAR